MDLLNQSFQNFLEERQFRMKTTPSEAQIKYQGRLALRDNVVIDFAIQVPKSDGREVVQLVFDNILVCPDEERRSFCLDMLNHINLTSGVYFYFVLREDGTIFARYMLPVDPDRTEVLLDLIQMGSKLIQQARDLLVETIL